MKIIYTIFTLSLCLLNLNINAQQIIDPVAVSNCEIANMTEINTPEFEFSPCFYGDGFAFVYSLKKKKSLFDRSINTSFFDLAFYFPDNSTFPFDSVQQMYHFDEELNSEFHEGPLCFHRDDICYYTREDADYKKSKKRKGKAVLQILVSKNHRNTWSPSTVLPFCDKNYNYCHPTLSVDGNTMIFASDQPGGYGKMDLYLTTKENNKWAEPYNLGAEINSTKNDWFPFYYKDSLLFFASDKPEGQGGLDIYVSQYSNNRWSEAEPLPSPLNSDRDDFGFILRDNGLDGYFSSSRPGGKGNDDIYRFRTPGSIMYQENNVEFLFTLLDSLDNKSVAGVKMKYIAINTKDRVFNIKDYNINLLKAQNEGSFLLELSPKADSKPDEIKSNMFGKLWGALDRNSPYILTFSKEGYEDYTTIFEPGKSDPNINITLKKQTKKKSVIVNNPPSDIYIPTTSGSKITFNNLYYDSNKATIKSGAAKELDALTNIMQQNNDIKIVLSAHTDAVGKESYNLLLSQKRADAAKSYLVRRGILEDRIIAIGIGEAEIINHCKNGVKCSKKEHKINRRTEVEIL